MRRVSPEQQREERQLPVKRRSSRAAAAKIREIMRENRERPFRELICGHYTYKEQIEQNSAWQPAKDVYWCHHCQFWTMEKPKIKAEELPEEPPF